jgi:hypothetical protein
MAAGFVQARRRKIKRRTLLWGSVVFFVSLGAAVVVGILLGTPFGGLPVLVIAATGLARLIDRDFNL